MADVVPLLQSPRLPKLRSLGLCNCEFTDELCSALLESPLLPRLRSLSLKMGTMTEAGATALIAGYLFPDSVAALQRAIPVTRSREQKVAEEYEGALHRYASVGEGLIWKWQPICFTAPARAGERMRTHASIAAAVLLLTGCGSSERLKPANATLQLSPFTLDFGPQEAGSSSVLPVTLTNAGSAPLTVSTRLERDARGAFSAGTPLTVLEPGGELELTVTYLAPLQEGPDGVSLVIESDSLSAPEVIISISGRSVAKRIDPIGQPVDAGAMIVEPVDAGLGTPELPHCPGAPPTIELGPVVPVPALPRLAWNGANNLLVHHGRELEAVTLRQDGVLDTPTQLMEGVSGRAVFNGAGYGLIVWRWLGWTGAEAVFARLTTAGALVLGSERPLPKVRDYQTDPALAWNGDRREWGVLWHEWDNGGLVYLRFARLNEWGALLDGSLVELGAGMIEGSGSMLVYGGGNFVALQQLSGPERLQLVRIDAENNVAFTDIADSATFHAQSVAWNGVEYGLSWVETLAGVAEVKLARVDKQGLMVIGSETTLHSYPFVEVPSGDLVASGAGWLATWSATPQSGRGEIFVARLNASGVLQPGSPMQLTCDAARDAYPVASTGGNPTVVAFLRFGAGGSQVFTAQIP